jgi:hypothetical protein
MITKQFYNSMAKTSHGGQTLYDHTLDCVKAGIHLANFWPHYDSVKRDVLIFSLFVHDIGKLDPTFQAMLEANLQGTKFKGRLVKHEACTFDHNHVELVERSIAIIAQEIKAQCGYELNPAHITMEALEWVWALAVTHHGLYYVSYESSSNENQNRYVRRQQTAFAPNETKRLTLTDILFEFYPLGGLVIMADQLASHAFEKGYSLDEQWGKWSSFASVLSHLDKTAAETEQSMAKDDPAQYQLKELLTLLAPN